MTDTIKTDSGRMPYFPMFVDLSEKKVLIVGSGTLAKRRVRVMKEFTRHLYLLAPEVNPELLQMEKNSELTILRKHYEREDLYGMDVVIAATSSAAVNRDIYISCRTLGILVNVASTKEMCDFFFPSIVKGSGVVAGISSSGTDKRATREAVAAVKNVLDPDSGSVAPVMARAPVTAAKSAAASGNEGAMEGSVK